MSEAPWLGWKAPVVLITGTLLQDIPAFVGMNPWHRCVHYDFDRDLDVYVWWPLVPTHWLVWFWIDSRMRWCIEQWASRHVFDIKEGCLLSSWRWRPLREWTWHRSRYVGGRYQRLPMPAKREKRAKPL